MSWGKVEARDKSGNAVMRTVDYGFGKYAYGDP